MRIKFQFTLALFLFLSCNDHRVIIKNIKVKDVSISWYKTSGCLSNGCDILEINENVKSKIIYKYYGSFLKDFEIENNNIIIYHSGIEDSEDFSVKLTGSVMGYNLYYHEVPANTCNYLEIQQKSRICPPAPSSNPLKKQQ